MSLRRCGRGWQWGRHGRCYTGPSARARALRQAAHVRGLAGVAADAGDVLVLYHGAHRFDRLEPEVRPSPHTRMQWGPGLYLTTNPYTAARYAKGGGKLLRFEVGALRFVHTASLPFEEMRAFAAQLRRKRRDVVARLDAFAARFSEAGAPLSHPVFAELLLNTMHNEGALAGEQGVELIRFYVRHGIDAALERGRGPAGDEDWVVLWNLRKVRAWRFVDAREPLVASPRIAP